MELWLVVIAIVVIGFLLVRERFQDTESPVTRPAHNSVWLSKIDAEAPIGGNDDDYIKVLQAFHDKVFVPSPTRPTIANVETFMLSPDAQVPGVDPNAIRKIIGNSFRIDKGAKTAAAREKEQTVLTGALAGFSGENLEPERGIDEVFVRKEQIYRPADTRLGDLPEGIYAPTEQQPTPRREGVWDDKSTSWTDTSFYSVCDGGACAKNVL